MILIEMSHTYFGNLLSLIIGVAPAASGNKVAMAGGKALARRSFDIYLTDLIFIGQRPPSENGETIGMGLGTSSHTRQSPTELC